MTTRISILFSAVTLGAALWGCTSTTTAAAPYVPLFVEPRELLPTDVARPPVVISGPVERFAEDLRAARIQGEVTVRMIIGVDGRASAFEAIKSDHPRLTEAAFETLASWKFSPATVNGAPVAVYYLRRMTYRTNAGW